MQKPLLSLFAFLLLSQISLAQFSDIRGQVLNADPTGDSLQFVSLQLKLGDVTAASIVTDQEGRFIFPNLNAGNYTLITNYIGFRVLKKPVHLDPNESKYVELYLESNENVLKGVTYTYTDMEVGDGGGGVEEEEIKENPYTNPLLGLVVDPNISMRNGTIRKGDTRPGTLGVIRDNTVQIGPTVPTQFNLGQIRLIASGVPAMYGDFVGGAIEYSSSNRLDTTVVFNALMRSSSPFNPYHQNALETYLYTPLKVKNGATKLSLSNAIYFEYNADDNPTAIHLYDINDPSKQHLLDQPITNVRGGTSIPTASQLTQSDFHRVNRKQNVAGHNIYTSLNLGWKTGENSLLKIEPSFHYIQQNQFSFANSLLNSDHNPLSTSMTGRFNVQFNQTLKSPYSKKGELLYDSTSAFSKINYVIIADYQHVGAETMDPIHKRNFFDYGHIGNFEKKGQDVYAYKDGKKTVKDQFGNDVTIDGYYEWVGYQDTSVQFASSGINQHRSVFTENVFDNNRISSLSDVNSFQGLLNGQNPSSIHSMWFGPGAIVTNYAKSEQTKASINAILNLSYHPNRKFKEQHDIQIGLLAEQRNRSFFSLNANALWQLMPQLLNQQYTGPDLANPILSYDQSGMFTDTVSYNWIYDAAAQSQFDARLRERVAFDNGHRSGNAHFIDVNTVNPDALSLDMFSADELLNNGNGYVSYAGYDHTGKRVRKRFGINDFLNDEDNRSIGSYAPIYSALWLQDKFVVKDITLRAGLRIERFDANQLVLRDEYSLYPVRTIEEVNSISGISQNHPSHLSPTSKVYVDDMNSPTKIVGYRDGSTWYDAGGVQIASAEQLRIQTTQGVIQPYLVDADNQSITANSFEDYSPELIVLPRMSFSFPISGSALFYAYYDMFAQRPSFGQSFAPITNYYYIENASNGFLANPALKPSRRTDYKLGYKQIVGKRSTLDFLVGYAEIKNEINLVQIEQAYPRSYTTYGNIDFSTVKSFKTTFDLSLDNLNFTAAYLLQFADGTGSNVNSAAALIQANQPNLRSLYPLSYDIRHRLTTNLRINLHQLATHGVSCLLENTTMNFIMVNQSGTPYTSYLNPIAEAQNLGSASRSQIKGNPFGSRLVGNSLLDMSITKAVRFGSNPIVFQLNVTNLLNTQNVYNVFAYSSLPNNDGFLASPQGQQQINNELSAQSFVDYYSLKQNNPGHFGNPRVVSLTVRTSF